MAAQVAQPSSTAGIAHSLRAVALHAGFKAGDGAQGASVDQFAQGQVIRIPAPILINTEQRALTLGSGNQGLGLFGVGGKGLVADHRHPVLDGFQHQGRATFEGGGNHQGIDAGFDDLADGVEGFDTGKVSTQLLATFG